MKYIIFFILSTFLYANENYTYNVKFGFLYKGTILSNFKDARSYLTKWLNEIAIIDNGKVDVKYYPDSKSLYKDYKENDLDMIVLNLDFFFENKEEIDSISTNYWTLLYNDVKLKQLYLISHKSLNIKDFKDLKGKNLTLKAEDIASLNWLNKNSLLSSRKTYLDLLKDVSYTDKESRNVLNVYFKKTDASIVSKGVWDNMIELNPSIKKKVEVIKKSKKIHLPFIGVFSKNANKIGKESFIRLSKDIQQLEGGDQISKLLKFDKLTWLENKDLEELKKYYDEYFKLKNKYK